MRGGSPRRTLRGGVCGQETTIASHAGRAGIRRMGMSSFLTDEAAIKEV